MIKHQSRETRLYNIRNLPNVFGSRLQEQAVLYLLNHVKQHPPRGRSEKQKSSIKSKKSHSSKILNLCFSTLCLKLNHLNWTFLPSACILWVFLVLPLFLMILVDLFTYKKLLWEDWQRNKIYLIPYTVIACFFSEKRCSRPVGLLPPIHN